MQVFDKSFDFLHFGQAFPGFFLASLQVCIKFFEPFIKGFKGLIEGTGHVNLPPLYSVINILFLHFYIFH